MESLVISEKTQSGPGVFGVSPWAVPLLVETYAKGKMKPYLQKHMKSVMGPWINDNEFKSISNSRDPKIRKALADMVSYLPKTPPGDLRINFFGKFEVSAGNEPMPDKRWKSRKAKTLFTFLAFKRSQGYTPKEVLMELLWPEDDPKKTLKRFHVLLATLRKILEPDILPGVASSYIVREGDGYRLSLGEKGATDFEEFMGLLEKGRQETDPEIVLRCFEKAESIYKGDFLEEDPYVDWCDQQRERFRNEYLSLLSWIMDDYEGKKSYDSCIAYAEKHLSVDPYAEDVYRRLMIYHLHNDSQKRAKEVYERCRKHLAEGLDCSVSPETESLYRQIDRPTK
ncbi:MAG: hypothetical protein GY866_43585 [Proteobacteria bacterium]|nr:hypothetical protein [Pseudomonadota bacterium]